MCSVINSNCEFSIQGKMESVIYICTYDYQFSMLSISYNKYGLNLHIFQYVVAGIAIIIVYILSVQKAILIGFINGRIKQKPKNNSTCFIYIQNGQNKKV